MLRMDQTEMIGRVAERLRAIADENRIRLLLALKEGEQTVGGLTELLGLGQASTSKHLGVLKVAGLVDCRKAGTQCWYRIKDPQVFEMCALVCAGVVRHIEAQQAALRGFELLAKAGSKKGKVA